MLRFCVCVCGREAWLSKQRCEGKSLEGWIRVLSGKKKKKGCKEMTNSAWEVSLSHRSTKLSPVTSHLPRRHTLSRCRSAAFSSLCDLPILIHLLSSVTGEWVKWNLTTYVHLLSSLKIFLYIYIYKRFSKTSVTKRFWNTHLGHLSLVKTPQTSRNKHILRFHWNSGSSFNCNPPVIY